MADHGGSAGASLASSDQKRGLAAGHGIGGTAGLHPAHADRLKHPGIVFPAIGVVAKVAVPPAPAPASAAANPVAPGMAGPSS